MTLSSYVNTFGQDLLKRYGERVHKLAINAGFTCPNRDGTKGRGGCTFCNNASFSPHTQQLPSVTSQIALGRQVLAKRTKAKRFLAYFQAYTNTYAEIDQLAVLYEEALTQPDVIGLSIGTRPDCINATVLDLLSHYQQCGYEIWIELGLQSSFDESLQYIQRGHTFADYQQAVQLIQQRAIPICTHLIIGLPNETRWHNLQSLQRVLQLGVQGLKLHPLHVVKHTVLAKQWQQGFYQPLSLTDYINIAVDMIERTPIDVVFHRVTATASLNILLTPIWCHKKWLVLNAIENTLQQRHTQQGDIAWN